MDKGFVALNTPLARALGLTLGWVAVSLLTFGAAQAFVADGDYRMPALASIALLSLLLALGLSAFGMWRKIGLDSASNWRETRLLLIPTLLVFLPLARGIHAIDPQLFGIFVLGYALTGFAEECMFRGVIVNILRPMGPMRVATFSALLFGAAHLSNILIRGNPPVIAAQAVGAACFGFGYAALRLRTKTIVPLIGLHFLTDLFLQMGNLPLIPVAVAQDVVLLVFGVVVLRRRDTYS